MAYARDQNRVLEHNRNDHPEVYVSDTCIPHPCIPDFPNIPKSAHWHLEHDLHCIRRSAGGRSIKFTLKYPNPQVCEYYRDLRTQGDEVHRVFQWNEYSLPDDGTPCEDRARVMFLFSDGHFNRAAEREMMGHQAMAQLFLRCGQRHNGEKTANAGDDLKSQLTFSVNRDNGQWTSIHDPTNSQDLWDLFRGGESTLRVGARFARGCYDPALIPNKFWLHWPAVAHCSNVRLSELGQCIQSRDWRAHVAPTADPHDPWHQACITVPTAKGSVSVGATLMRTVFGLPLQPMLELGGDPLYAELVTADCTDLREILEGELFLLQHGAQLPAYTVKQQEFPTEACARLALGEGRTLIQSLVEALLCRHSTGFVIPMLAQSIYNGLASASDDTKTILSEALGQLLGTPLYQALGSTIDRHLNEPSTNFKFSVDIPLSDLRDSLRDALHVADPSIIDPPPVISTVAESSSSAHPGDVAEKKAPVDATDITSEMVYFGEVNSANEPHGMGCLFLDFGVGGFSGPALCPQRNRVLVGFFRNGEIVEAASICSNELYTPQAPFNDLRVSTRLKYLRDSVQQRLGVLDATQDVALPQQVNDATGKPLSVVVASDSATHTLFHDGGRGDVENDFTNKSEYLVYKALIRDGHRVKNATRHSFLGADLVVDDALFVEVKRVMPINGSVNILVSYQQMLSLQRHTGTYAFALVFRDNVIKYVSAASIKKP